MSQSDSEFIGRPRAIADSRRLVDAFRRPVVSQRDRQLEQRIQLGIISLELGLPQTALRALRGEFTS